MRRTPLVHALIAAVVLLVGGLAFANQEAVGNQQGPGVGSRTENMIGLCDMNGGGVSVDVAGDRTVNNYHSWTKVTCVGGFLDGLTCTFTAGGTICDWSKVGMAAGSGESEVTVANQDLIFVSELPAEVANPLHSTVLEGPMLVEAVITWNPSAEAVTTAGVIQVNACRQLGGVETVNQSGDASSMTIACEGGLLEGHWCDMSAQLSMCFFEPGTGPDVVTTGASTVTPTVPAMPDEPSTPADAMPTTAPTTLPTETALPTATAVPTDEPVIEPTAPPVEPTLPMFEEDPTPTPTLVILT